MVEETNLGRNHQNSYASISQQCMLVKAISIIKHRLVIVVLGILTKDNKVIPGIP